MIISNNVEIKWNSKIKKHYTERGYNFTKMGDSFYPLIEDITKGCNSFIVVECDYCGKIFNKIAWRSVNILNSDIPKFCCDDKKCTTKKSHEIILFKYGVDSTFDLDFVKEKIKKTNICKFGCENPFGNIDIQDKIKKTNLKKFGHSNPNKNKKIVEKNKADLFEKIWC